MSRSNVDRVKTRRFRRTTVVSVGILAVFPLSGCGVFAGWDEMAETQPSGNTAISLSESGDISVHMIACDIAVESVELQILTDKAGAPPLGEQVSLDTPQSGYVVVTLPHSSEHEPPVLNSIMNDPQRKFWVRPLTYKGKTNELRFVPPLNGLTLETLDNHPRGSLLVQNYIPGTHGPETLDEVSLDDFKHCPASSRPSDCHID